MPMAAFKAVGQATHFFVAWPTAAVVGATMACQIHFQHFGLLVMLAEFSHADTAWPFRIRGAWHCSLREMPTTCPPVVFVACALYTGRCSLHVACLCQGGLQSSYCLAPMPTLRFMPDSEGKIAASFCMMMRLEHRVWFRHCWLASFWRPDQSVLIVWVAPAASADTSITKSH